MQRKTLEELNVLDDFLLNAIANDPDVGDDFFREVLSILLEQDIGEITVKAQTIIPGNTPELRGIRLDVEIQQEDRSPAKCRLYNIEAQTYSEENLQKRSRFYQAKKDSHRLKSGEKNWDRLPDLYMIMITTFDPFGKDGMIYTFENTCKEYPDLENRDGLKYIYFNAGGSKGGTDAIKQLLCYLKESKIENVTNSEISHIHDYVTTVKQSAEVRDRYMTIGEIMDMSKAEGIEEGRRTGREEGLAEGTEKGKKLGRIQSLLEILSELGDISPKLEEEIYQADLPTLQAWLKLAMKSESVDAFALHTKQ